MGARYVTPAGAAALRRHRYHGRDHSLLYAYVLSPWAEWCVARLAPLWLAPNAITALGIAAQLAAFVCLWCHCPALAPGDAPPPWTAWLAAAALFVYQTADNMDGKQARRTGSASPLGLLFDHGLDSINGAILGPLITHMVIGPSAIGGGLVAFYICAVPFVLNTWEEFHTHEFHLPVVNGPNEGLAVLMAAYAGTALAGGRAVWAQPASHPALVALARGARPLFAAAHMAAGSPPAAAWAAAAQPPAHADLILVLTLGAALATGALHVATVARHVLFVRREGAAGLAAAAGRLLPFATLMAAAGAWLRVAPTAVAARAHPWGFYLAIGSSLADLTSKLNLAHVAGQAYRPPWAGIALLALAPLLAACAPAAAQPLVEPLLCASTVVCVSSLLHLCVHAPREVADALDIDIFSIQKQRARAARELQGPGQGRRS
jgi:ethanolaminephosphotransferase